MNDRHISPIARQGRIVVSAVLLFTVISGHTADFDVTVLDSRGEPVSGVAVYIRSLRDGRLPRPAEPAVMTQLDTRFVPHLLIVQTGTRVRFPNNDVVAHHVYSFSRPNDFVLPMFKGNMRPEVEFKHAGVVTLGCNIHDHMVGYILVVDSRIFGKTNDEGSVHLTADNSNGLSISIWSPRIRLDDENLTQRVKAGRSAKVTFLLTEELRVRHTRQRRALSWVKN